MDDLTRFALKLALGAAFVIAPTTTQAAAPVVEQSAFVVEDEPLAGCGGFEIIADGAGTTRTTTYFDSNGVPIRVAFHGRYKGSMTNSVTGFAIMDAPSVANITFDLVSGTQTNVGAFFTVTVPGVGVVLIEAGRIVFDGAGPPVFIAGPHLPPGAQIAALCEALR